ncbi:MAG: wax ester/triacylglycerol synthase family O-acyltransferase [Acidimicrobiales bacterium]|jgi:WS/DGAT/MGAT family acyltransferase|nr:wax ester/triacylglycerol synthase family O-acyltransferase [Acidimicrobiales bacterium]
MSEHLSALDASFLAAERPGVPLHIGGIARFEGGPLLDGDGRVRIDEIRRVVEAHLAAIPRFRRRLQSTPLNATLPLWVDDEHFDIAAHVHAVTVPDPGGDAEVWATVMGIQREALDRRRPLWDLTFLDGLADGSVVLVDRAHHALVDGVSGSESLVAMLDPDPAAPIPEPVGWEPEAGPDAVHQVAEALGALAHLPGAAARGLAGLARAPGDLVDVVRSAAHALRAERTAPRCSLNVAVGPRRDYRPIRLALDDVKAVAHATGTKVNDVVLAAVTGGLHDLMAERGELGHLDHLVALVPVSTRGDDEHLGLGNKVSAILASLPVDLDDPAAALRSVADQMARHKGSHETELVAALLGSADWLPPGVLSVLSDATVNHQPLVNLVITNVPGVQAPLYLLGARMTECLPYVPLSGNTTVGIAILSYDGRLDLGITVDPDACPDADVLVAGIERAFDELAAR